MRRTEQPSNLIYSIGLVVTRKVETKPLEHRNKEQTDDHSFRREHVDICRWVGLIEPLELRWAH
jgi:hypothetical protein